MNKLVFFVLVVTLFATLCVNAQTVIEAEASTGNNAGTAVINQAGASGGQVIGGFGNLNSFISFIRNGLAGGTYNLTFRYSNGTGVNQSLTIYHYLTCNTCYNVPVTKVLFPPTANWETFAEITVSIFLNSGVSNINEPGQSRFKIQKLGQHNTNNGPISEDHVYRDFVTGAGPRFDTITLSYVVWTGAVNDNWNTAGNWFNNAVPPATAIISIPAGLARYPVIKASSNITIGGAVIATGASLTIDANASLSVTGNSLTNLIPTTELPNFRERVTDTGTITNNGTITNYGNLFLKSTAAGTANLLSNTTVNNVTQERLITQSNQRGWRLVSNPMGNTTFAPLALASNITIGAHFTGAYDAANNTWSSTDGAAAFDNNQAYKLFIRNNVGVTLVNKGTAANTTPSSTATTAGRFYLVANPYTSAISVSRILAASTGLSASVSYYNPTNGAPSLSVMGGGYDTRALSPLPLAGRGSDMLIPPMGAVFVQATSNGTINVPKTAIFTGFQIVDANNTAVNPAIFTHKMARSQVPSEFSALTIDVINSGVDYDKLQLRFKEAGNIGSNIEFGKMPNTFLDFYYIDKVENKAISELDLKEQTIPLGIKATLQQNFTFKVTENTIPTGFEALLIDNYLNKSTVLEQETVYNFVVDSKPASQGNGRFSITLRASSSLGINANDVGSTIQVWPNPAHNEINITNSYNDRAGDSFIEISSLNGQVIHSQKSNPGITTIVQTKNWAKGVYILIATNNGTKIIKKLIIQ